MSNVCCTSTAMQSTLVHMTGCCRQRVQALCEFNLTNFTQTRVRIAAMSAFESALLHTNSLCGNMSCVHMCRQWVQAHGCLLCWTGTPRWCQQGGPSRMAALREPMWSSAMSALPILVDLTYRCARLSNPSHALLNGMHVSGAGVYLTSTHDLKWLCCSSTLFDANPKC